MRGDGRAGDELLRELYDELRQLAQHRLARLPPGQTLQGTALVHEAYLRLIRPKDNNWEGRGHFFGAAAQAMRDVLVDNARSKDRLKRGGEFQRVSVDASLILGAEQEDLDVLALEEALQRFESEHPERTQVVLLRFFGGLSVDETAACLGVAPATVDRRWAFARAWLYRELSGPGDVEA